MPIRKNRRILPKIASIDPLRLQRLCDAASELSAELNPPEVLKFTVKKAMELLGLSSGVIFLLDPSRSEPVARVTVKMPPGPAEVRFAADPGISADVFRSGRTVVINDCRRFCPEDSPLRRAGHTALIETPLWMGNRIVGSLSLQSRRVNKEITPEDCFILEELAKHAAIAIFNADRLSALNRLNQQLEKQLEARSLELERLTGEILKKEKLAVIGQVAGGINHELRQPLEAITNAAYYLRFQVEQKEPGPLRKDWHKFLKIIADECAEATELVSGLLDFARTKDAHPVWTDLNELIEVLLKKIRIPAGVEFELSLAPRLCSVFLDPVQVARAFWNIITNALEAMPGGGSLRISTQFMNHSVSVTVKDNGEGISPENLKRLFEPLFTTKKRGVGLGLIVVRQYLEANRGRIKIQSREGRGTSVQVSFPVSRAS